MAKNFTKRLNYVWIRVFPFTLNMAVVSFEIVVVATNHFVCKLKAAITIDIVFNHTRYKEQLALYQCVDFSYYWSNRLIYFQKIRLKDNVLESELLLSLKSAFNPWAVSAIPLKNVSPLALWKKSIICLVRKRCSEYLMNLK